jgi:hypothetical protein
VIALAFIVSVILIIGARRKVRSNALTAAGINAALGGTSSVDAAVLAGRRHL